MGWISRQSGPPKWGPKDHIWGGKHQSGAHKFHRNGRMEKLAVSTSSCRPQVKKNARSRQCSIFLHGFAKNTFPWMVKWNCHLPVPCHATNATFVERRTTTAVTCELVLELELVPKVTDLLLHVQVRLLRPTASSKVLQVLEAIFSPFFFVFCR